MIHIHSWSWLLLFGVSQNDTLHNHLDPRAGHSPELSICSVGFSPCTLDHPLCLSAITHLAPQGSNYIGFLFFFSNAQFVFPLLLFSVFKAWTFYFSNSWQFVTSLRSLCPDPINCETSFLFLSIMPGSSNVFFYLHMLERL